MKDLPLGGVSKIDVVLPYIAVVVLLMSFPFVCGIITDHVVAERPAEENILYMLATLEVSQEERSRVKVVAE